MNEAFDSILSVNYKKKTHLQNNRDKISWNQNYVIVCEAP